MTPARAGAFLLGAALMIAEVALLRALSFAAWYHFAFLVTGIAMLGGSFAGAWRSVRPTPWPRSACVAALLLALVVVLLHTLSFGGGAHPWLARAAIVLAIGAAAFALSLGLADALLAEDAARVYAADLAGAAGGAVAALALLPIAGAHGTLWIAAVLAASAAVLGWRGRRALPVLIALVLATATPLARASLSPRVAANKSIGREATDDLLARRTLFSAEDAVARIDVVTTAEGARILIDGGSAMSRVPANPERPPADALFPELWERARGQRVLVIGSGGGFEVALALQYGAAHVVAVELSGATLDYVRHHAGAGLRAMFADPRVTVVHDEARSFLERHADRFGLIVAAHTIANAAATSALFLTEDMLLTREAIATLLAHLDEQGVLYVSRPAVQIATLHALVASVTAGARSWRWPSGDGFFAAVVVDRRGTLAPARAEEGVAAPSVTLPSDDRPYFHAFATRASVREALVAGAQVGGAQATRRALEELPLGWAAAWASAIAAFLCLALLGWRARARPPAIGAAICTGIGFLLIELPAIARMTVLVGAPSRGFAAVVAGMLIGAAVVSARRQRPHALRPFLFACA
ncbi:MAG: hypothetical protein IT381_15405, partial [Deltaproteobacteria bacterium]|nr:hypothetical protein [Deltaproteobacteria bacterium]